MAALLGAEIGQAEEISAEATKGARGLRRRERQRPGPSRDLGPQSGDRTRRRNLEDQRRQARHDAARQRAVSIRR